ncbi:hypothetical protein KKC44_04310 [Patescibacteria group bacterium]|nr:hypothetical protein [Patescibacteria group bacterium]MBU2259801.1 hypothetical protein [Patescibacteria group bacterium]
MNNSKKDKDKKKTVSDSVKNEIKKFNDSNTRDHVLSLFKAALSTSPIGGFFASLIDDYIPSRRIIRIEEFMKEAAETLIRHEAQIDSSRIKTDHYAYIFEQCLRGVALHHQPEKIECYRAILVNAAKQSSVPDDAQEYYLSLVDRLTPLHIKLLGILDRAAKMPRDSAYPGSQDTIQSILKGVDKDVLVGLYSEFENINFTNTNATYFESLVNVPLERVEGRINATARKFIEFITLDKDYKD